MQPYCWAPSALIDCITTTRLTRVAFFLRVQPTRPTSISSSFPFSSPSSSFLSLSCSTFLSSSPPPLPLSLSPRRGDPRRGRRGRPRKRTRQRTRTKTKAHPPRLVGRHHSTDISAQGRLVVNLPLEKVSSAVGVVVLARWDSGWDSALTSRGSRSSSPPLPSLRALGPSLVDGHVRHQLYQRHISCASQRRRSFSHEEGTSCNRGQPARSE